MSELRAFQQEFVGAIDRPSASLSAMTVCRSTGLAGAIEALAANFPVTRALLGDELFFTLASAHVATEPPETPILAHYGRQFSDWLAVQPVSGELTYLVDVARCDRMHLEALFAADAPALQGSDLKGLAPLVLWSLRLRLHPATRFGWLATPAIDIWIAHQHDVEDEVVIDWRPAGALFTRPGHSVFGHSIGRAGNRLLHGIQLGETLGEAAAAAGQFYPGADIGSLFAELLAAGAFHHRFERTR